MANLSGTGCSFLDKVLPTYGNEIAVKTPIWSESQHMFITDQYTSASGNTYYLGVRISERFVTVLHIGLYHNWTYINEVELYVFDGKGRKLVGSEKIDQYYNEELVKRTTKTLLSNYISSQMKLNDCHIDGNKLEAQVEELVQKSYCSMLGDSNVKQKLDAIKPLLENKK